MLKLIERGLDGNGIPRTTSFRTGDEIHIIREKGRQNIIRTTIHRLGTIILLGNEHEISLRLSVGATSTLTANQVWHVTNLFLQANWILAEVIEDTRNEVRAVIRRIATCSVEMDPRLPSGDAGGDGFGRG